MEAPIRFNQLKKQICCNLVRRFRNELLHQRPIQCPSYCSHLIERFTNPYSCLFSEVIRNDTLKGQRHSIPKDCRQQIRSQLFQQRENIDFDPVLKAACKKEIKEICGNIPHGSGQVNKQNASDVPNKINN